MTANDMYVFYRMEAGVMPVPKEERIYELCLTDDEMDYIATMLFPDRLEDDAKSTRIMLKMLNTRDRWDRLYDKDVLKGIKNG